MKTRWIPQFAAWALALIAVVMVWKISLPGGAGHSLPGGRESEGASGKRSYESAEGSERDRRGHNRPTGSEERLQRQAEARELAQGLILSGQELPVHRMWAKTDEVPDALIAELAGMDADQFRTVALIFGKDESVHPSTRVKLLVSMITGWMKRQEDPGPGDLQQMFATLDQLHPLFPPGESALIVDNSASQGLRWDQQAMIDYLLRWHGRKGQPLPAFSREMVLRYSADPEAAQRQIDAAEKAGR